jgi:hypothetical protein
MIPPKIQSILVEYKPTLPTYIQEALDSFDWISVCQEIAAKYRLTAKQEELFLAETVMVLFEIVDAGLFKPNIMNHVGLSEVITHNILMDVNNRVIARLQTELTRIVGDSPEILRNQLFAGSDDLPNSEIHPYAPQAMPTSNIPIPTQSSPVYTTSPDPYHEPID